MFEAAITEFPFVADLPKREKSKLQTIWDRFNELKALQEKHGMLVPAMMAAKLLGVSHQRVSELMEAGRLERVSVGWSVFVTEESVVAYAMTERKAGRPFKGPQSYGEVTKMAVDFGVECYRSAKKRRK